MYRNVHVNNIVIHMYRLNYVAWAAFELLPLSSGQNLLPACQNTHPLEHWKKECKLYIHYIQYASKKVTIPLKLIAV